ncbi:MAG: serine hydrolase domain-containing protein [Pseudomonadota bacterium]
MTKSITSWMKKEHVPGLAACVVRGTDIVWAEGFGMADLENQIPFTPDRSIFQIASVSKVITAVAIMQLRDKGHFRLDDDVSGHAGFTVRNPKFANQPITYRHLLRHVSSIRDTDGIYALYAVGDPTLTLQEVVCGYFTEGSRYWHKKNFYSSQPGQREKYSNIGFALLGLLIENISGQSLNDYLRDNIYAPLGMVDTSFFIEDLDQSRQTFPYTYQSKPRRQLCPGDGDGNLLPSGAAPTAGFNKHALYSYPTLADGMVRTTVTQLARFMTAMMNDGQFQGYQMLKPDTVSEMLSGDEQGLGWVRDGKYWGHDGGDPGCASEMFFDRKDRFGFIILANADVELDRVRPLILSQARKSAVS